MTNAALLAVLQIILVLSVLAPLALGLIVPALVSEFSPSDAVESAESGLEVPVWMNLRAGFILWVADVRFSVDSVCYDVASFIRGNNFPGERHLLLAAIAL